MKKKILITGGAGFIGSHLCSRLLSLGNEVLCLDNFFTGSKLNIKKLLHNPDFELIRHDITFPIYLEIDSIYNLACPASPINYQFDPVQTIKTSIMGSINVLGLAKRLKIKALQTSTSEVYGDPAFHYQREEYWGNVNPIGIRSCYDEGKRCAETLFFDYHRQHQLEIKIARIFNTYGPNMQPNDGRVISNFIVQALQGKNITLYGGGNQTRSFCYINDMINALIKLMNTDSEITGPINLGNPQEITIKRLAHLIIELTNSKSNIVKKELPNDDPKVRCPIIKKANNILDWNPTTDLKTGLLETINYFDNLLSGEIQ